MREHCVRRLPVLDTTGKLLGIVSLTDVVRAVALEHSAAGKAKVADTLVAICAPHSHKAMTQSAELQEQQRERSSGSGRRSVSRRSESSAEKKSPR
jgi:CBS domain-containing protein